VERARLLLPAIRSRRNREKARAVLNGIKLGDSAKAEIGKLALQARMAEIEGHKADALALYAGSARRPQGSEAAGRTRWRRSATCMEGTGRKRGGLRHPHRQAHRRRGER